MKYLLSIVIPTKNRSYYCIYAVKQILSLDMPGVEICIQDNSDKDDLELLIKDLNSSNVVYNYHPGVLSFVDNFSEAISLCHGEYVCMIGDDDGALPVILNYTKKAKEENLDAIIPALSYVYFWPSDKTIIKDAEGGLLKVNVQEQGERFVNPQKALNKLLSNAVQHYTSLDVPRLYHGIVKKDVLDAIKSKTGHYFGGLTPDMYIATVLALECKKVKRISDSVTISGICAKSGSADSATGKHTGMLSEAPHFRGHSSYEWNSSIPSFYSVDTIWAETLIHALVDYKREDLIPKFNAALFIAVCLKKYPTFSLELWGHAKKNNISKMRVKWSYFCFNVRYIMSRADKKITRVIKQYVFGRTFYYREIPNLSNIIDVEKEISNINN